MEQLTRPLSRYAETAKTFETNIFGSASLRQIRERIVQVRYSQSSRQHKERMRSWEVGSAYMDGQLRSCACAYLSTIPKSEFCLLRAFEGEIVQQACSPPQILRPNKTYSRDGTPPQAQTQDSAQNPIENPFHLRSISTKPPPNPFPKPATHLSTMPRQRAAAVNPNAAGAPEPRRTERTYKATQPFEESWFAPKLPRLSSALRVGADQEQTAGDAAPSSDDNDFGATGSQADDGVGTPGVTEEVEEAAVVGVPGPRRTRRARKATMRFEESWIAGGLPRLGSALGVGVAREQTAEPARAEAAVLSSDDNEHGAVGSQGDGEVQDAAVRGPSQPRRSERKRKATQRYEEGSLVGRLPRLSSALGVEI